MNINGTAVRRGAVSVTAAAFALGALGACGGGEQGPAGAPGNITQAGSVVSTGDPQPSSQPSQPPAPSAEKSPGRTTSGAPDKGKPPAPGGGGGAECTKMKVTQSQPRGSGQEHFALLFTNEGSAPCTVRGFPGVRLDGADGSSWDLTRTAKEITPIEVAPGQHASADLTYLSAADGGAGPAWQVARMAVTPPHTTDTQIVPWAVGKPVAKQDAATHPGTYIDPVRPAATG
ncbi:DUF4232 domain-containing protein [Amycolatopsis sp. CA-230715]|uniref:DUF4232 domain-containing protein n=1 Tax=Amycolatopsis sp. CA-230715 TaxID=2745196 RepID=UPI001C0190A2|nr:DUF4232 domain-containing protein [Amycolatopsis sp. CA-230715]QWF78389.1 hypothetical protein HUW46_01785 [Amycolatopsis sp. CA-230715]